MNWEASHLADREEFQRAMEKERLLKAEREWDKEVFKLRVQKVDCFKLRLRSCVRWKGFIRPITSLVLTR